MARYILEASGTPQAYALLVKNPHDRAEANRAMFEKLGGKIEAYYVAADKAKHYVIVEFSNPLDFETLEALVVTSHAAGGQTDLTIPPVLTSAEMVGALKKGGELGYTPPSS